MRHGGDLEMIHLRYAKEHHRDEAYCNATTNSLHNRPTTLEQNERLSPMITELGWKGDAGHAVQSIVMVYIFLRRQRDAPTVNIDRT